VIKLFRNKSFVTLFWGFMALYLINLSVDTLEPKNEATYSNFNYQESIVEIVFEKILGFDNLIIECNDNDSSDYTSKGKVKIDIVESLKRPLVFSSFNFTLRHVFPSCKFHLVSTLLQRDFLPPEI